MGAPWVAALDRLVSGELHARARLVVSTAGFGIIVAVATLDYLTGPALSLSASYVLVVLVMTLCGGFALGFSAAAVTAAVWTSSDALTSELGLGVAGDAWNAVVRFVALVTVVVLITALVSTRAEAQASADRSREFLAVAAHQLRTPVAAMQASVEAIAHAPPGRAQERLVTNAMTESARLGSLISSLLRVARLDQGEPLNVREVELWPLVAAEVGRMRDLSSLDFRLVVADDVPKLVCIDEDATANALANLLDNARRHAVHRVSVEVVPSGTHVVVAVADDGPGLPQGSESAAFERFVTLDQGGGAGLGLPIARMLARTQGGDVLYEAKRFHLLLPAPPCGHGESPMLSGEAATSKD